jgi:multiple sugar transport system substrate-binding protein
VFSGQRNPRRSPGVSRREALLALGSAGAVVALVACSGTAQTASTTATAASSAAGSPGAPPTRAAISTAVSTRSTAVTTSATSAGQAAPNPTAESAIHLPNTGAKLPTGPVTFRWIDAGLNNRNFFPKFFPVYHQAHPNITIQYDNVTDADLQRITAAGLQNGNLQDVFRLEINVPVAQLVKEGSVAPLDDMIPDFAAWKGAFPANSFLEGINVFGGKTYSWPHLSSKYFGSLMLYNLAYLQQAGYDPAAKSLTWDGFRAAAKKITQQGQGKYYGYLIAGGVTTRWSAFVSTLANLSAQVAGASDIDWRTGEYAYTNDAYLAAINLLLAMKADGSIYPGSVSINQQDAAARMPTGIAGMFLSEASNIASWLQQNPEFKFGVASPPVPSSGPVVPLSVAPHGTFWFAYGKSKNLAISGDLFSYLGSAAGQTAFQIIGGGGPPLSFPQANQIPQISPQTRQAYTLYDILTRFGPDPNVRNPDVALVSQELRAVTPDFGTTVQGIYTGQLNDAKKAMQDLQDRSNQELDRAIKAAQAKGAKVSRADWVFPNWDAMKDYTTTDYQALKRS